MVPLRRRDARSRGILRAMLDMAFRMTAVPGAEDRLVAALLENATASRDEPGVLFFEVLRSSADPRVVLVVERYTSPEAFDAHKTTAHYAAWKALAPQLVEANERFVTVDLP